MDTALVVVLIIVALASVFAHAGSTLGAFDALAKGMIAFTKNEVLMLLLINALILCAGMVLDAISIFLVFLPILVPIALVFQWDMTWFGIMLTVNLAIGACTPPMAVNLMVTCRILGCSMESTVPWIVWFVGSMIVALLLVTFIPDIALFLPDGRLATRKLPSTERKALEILDARDTWTRAEIRKQYKSLVKDLHPDMNGGNRDDEARLQEVVWAWEQIRESRYFRD